MKLRIDPLLVEMARVFNARGKRVFLVGGAVRDMLRGAAAHDWDLASDALPAEVCAMFGHVIKTGLKHGTVTVIFRGRAVEVTTFRTEAGYADGRRPDEVRFAATVEEDLSRRDFTMNAVALELPSGAPVDPFGGAEDIRRRLIRCVGQAAERFAEDGLRPLRALRFAATLGFALDEGMEGAIAGALGVTAMVSAERVRDELEKIVLSDNPAAALDAMERTGLLRLILPELAACVGVEQKGRHRFDVYEHSVRALEYAARMKAGLEVRLAALLHDVGKPSAAALDERGVWTFYNHERASAELVRAALFRLRFPNRVIDRVVHLVAEHMFHYEDVWNDAAVRRFIA
ncbi:MAG: CCA tRNA nucleotidyltransferase, partial [Spirochaetaceae bacterium]|nr:CCA tRNA nucleotidyltransferase [Spirochaetaceae bacterium]